MTKIDFDKIEIEYDILIVGAGTAGLMAAYTLSSHFRILLIDYRSLPRHKVCSGIIVKQGLDIIEELNPPSYIYKKPKKIDITYVDWNNNKRFITEKNFLNTDRETFDKWFFERVSELKNVQIADETRLMDFSDEKNNENIVTILKSSPERIKSVIVKYMIGCDGALSLVRKKLFNKSIPFYIAIQETIEFTPINKAYFIFDKEITDHYCWLIPKNETIEIGAALYPYKPKERFDIFRSKVENKFGIKGNGFLESAIILRPDNMKDITLGKGNILLAGEAAGLITPSGAEGISNALISGKLAAESITENPKNSLFTYKRKCKELLERFEKKIEKSKILKDPVKRNKYFK